jgi:hypothetical protein
MRPRRRYRSAILAWAVIVLLLALGGALAYRHHVGCGPAAGEAAAAICRAYDATLPYVLEAGPFLETHEHSVTTLLLVVLALCLLMLALATRNAARAGQAAAGIAEQALMRLHRAFVFPRDFAAVGVVAQPSGPAIRVRFKWHNSGGTPARGVKAQVGWDHWQGEIPGGFAFPGYGGGVFGGTYIAPSSDLPSPTIDIDVAIIEATRVGQIRTFLWGEVTYEDVFAATHVTRFCWEIHVRGDSAYAANARLEISTTTHARNNCIDEDCG